MSFHPSCFLTIRENLPEIIIVDWQQENGKFPKFPG